MENPLSMITFTAGAIFILAGIILRLFPPKKINYLYGYRTRSSMRSQQHWDFSQQYAANKMITGGFVMLLIAAVGLYIPVLNDVLSLVLGLGSMVVIVIWLFVKTETAIKKRF